MTYIYKALTEFCSPVLGGSLANPADRYPGVFSSFLSTEHPYLLACLSGVFFRVAGFLVVLFYLKEVWSSPLDCKFFWLNPLENRHFLQMLPRSMMGFSSKTIFWMLVKERACQSQSGRDHLDSNQNEKAVERIRGFFFLDKSRAIFQLIICACCFFRLRL